MDPLTIVTGITGALKAGRSLASLSKEIGNFFDGADTAKKNHSRKMQRKFVSVNQEALSTWSDKMAYEQAEKELQAYISNNFGRSKWLELLKIRREILAEKREAEARARREAIERQEFLLTFFAILILILTAATGALAYLHHMQWIDIFDWFR